MCCLYTALCIGYVFLGENGKKLTRVLILVIEFVKRMKICVVV